MFSNIKVYLFWVTQATCKQSTPGENAVDSPETLKITIFHTNKNDRLAFIQLFQVSSQVALS